MRVPHRLSSALGCLTLFQDPSISRNPQETGFDVCPGNGCGSAGRWPGNFRQECQCLDWPFIPLQNLEKCCSPFSGCHIFPSESFCLLWPCMEVMSEGLTEFRVSGPSSEPGRNRLIGCVSLKVGTKLSHQRRESGGFEIKSLV